MLMRTIDLALLIVGLLLTSLASYAVTPEHKVMVRGYIYDEDYQPLDSVSVRLALSDSVNVPFKILTDNIDGKIITGSELRIMFDAAIGTEYQLILDKEGFEPLVKEVKATSRSHNLIYLSTLKMTEERFHELDEVTVTATRVKMVMKGDTVVFDAGAFRLAEGSMLEELVRQLPGATLSTDGVITYNGHKINELLVNGKDFFKGDPKVALRNLPSYTVKDLKIYDKTEDDDYLTHAKAKLDTDEANLNLVLDVELKKEYNVGRMANAEAGYGSNSRYQGRVFMMGYTDNLRIAAFVNANNIGSNAGADTSGEWSGGWEQPGLTSFRTGGMDYSLDGGKKVKLNGNVTVTHENNDNTTIQSSTSFYPSGDLYNRNRTQSLSRTNRVASNHTLRLSADNFFLHLSPSVDWSRNRTVMQSLTATFDAPVSDLYRGQALDSVFSSGILSPSSRYTRQLLTSLRKLSAMQPDNLNATVSANATVSPKNWKGRMSLYTSASLTNSDSKTRTIYDQQFGEANTSAASPERSDRFSPVTSRRRTMGLTTTYYQSNRNYGEKYTNTLSFNGNINFSYSSNHGDTELYVSDPLPETVLAPSITCPEYAVADLANSFYSSTMKNAASLSGMIMYQHEPTAPADSALNPAFAVMAHLEYSHQHNRLDYDKPDVARQLLSRDNNFITPRITVSFQSSNKKRSMSVVMMYALQNSAPDLNYYLTDRASSNPMEVYTGAGSALSNSTTHSLNLLFSRYSRALNHRSINSSLNWSVTRNSIANARRYDYQTGVTTNIPTNISGNWNLNHNIGFTGTAGKQRQISFSTNLMTGLTNSVDYLTRHTDPERSSVLTLSIGPSATAEYKLSSGTSVTAGFSMTALMQSADNQTSSHAYYSYTPFVSAFVKLPASFEFITRLNCTMKRGFDNRSMDTNEWIWNATLTKSLLKGAMTLKLTAADILGSVDRIRYTINAQGRQETWQNTLPRYIMLSCGYRFDMKPQTTASHR